MKLSDLWKSRGEKTYELDDIMLLKVGRHIRPEKHFKLIVSREEGEGKFLQGYRKQYDSLKTTSHAGPLALIDGELVDQDLELAARIVARYSQGKNDASVTLEYRNKQGETSEMHVRPLAPDEMPAKWLL